VWLISDSSIGSLNLGALTVVGRSNRPCSPPSAMLALAVIVSPTLLAVEPPVERLGADALVQQLRDLPPYLYVQPQVGGTYRPKPPPWETKRCPIYSQLDKLGVPAVRALARGLRSSDVDLRLNVLLALQLLSGALGSGWCPLLKPIDISAALPSLTKALDDSDREVRSRAAFTIDIIRWAATPALPAPRRRAPSDRPPT